MANKNITSPTATRIFQAWEREGRSERPRTYLGASVIGHECDAWLWYHFRQVVREDFDGRMYRLFDRGKREEAVFCADLRRIGCEVKEFGEDGSQFAVSALGGHFGGHLDGVARGFVESPNEWHVVEFKTHADSSFKKLCKDGVALSKPMHFAQMQVYMGLTGLKSAIYMAVDKDDDNLWVERVKFNQQAFDSIMARAKHIIDTVSPDRCAKRPDDFRCKACPAASICWHASGTLVEPSVPVSCRTCCHATAVTDKEGAAWTCHLGHACTSGKTDCSDHLVLPFLVNGEVVEGDCNGILYDITLPDGKTDGVTIGKRGLSTAEAKMLKPCEVRTIDKIKEHFPTAKVVETNETLRRYQDETKFEIAFSGTMAELNEYVKHTATDFSKPIRTETDGEKRLFVYPLDVLLVTEGDTATVYTDKLPF